MSTNGELASLSCILILWTPYMNTREQGHKADKVTCYMLDGWGSVPVTKRFLCCSHFLGLPVLLGKKYLGLVS